MIQIVVKKKVILVDETRMSEKTLAKVLAKGLARTVFERETGREGGDLAVAMKRIEKDPEEYFSQTGSASPVESEIKRLLKKYIETKGLNKGVKMSSFIKTEEYQDLLKKALVSESFQAKAKEILAQKEMGGLKL